jgi:hypothetical protein
MRLLVSRQLQALSGTPRVRAGQNRQQCESPSFVQTFNCDHVLLLDTFKMQNLASGIRGHLLAPRDKLSLQTLCQCLG